VALYSWTNAFFFFGNRVTYICKFLSAYTASHPETHSCRHGRLGVNLCTADINFFSLSVIRASVWMASFHRRRAGSEVSDVYYDLSQPSKLSQWLNPLALEMDI